MKRAKGVIDRRGLGLEPAGRHVVRFEYRSGLLMLEPALSAAGLALVGLLLLRVGSGGPVRYPG